jgi:hypothetical protein
VSRQDVGVAENIQILADSRIAPEKPLVPLVGYIRSTESATPYKRTKTMKIESVPYARIWRGWYMLRRPPLYRRCGNKKK